MARTVDCTSAILRGRMSKANGFLRAAEIIEPFILEDEKNSIYLDTLVSVKSQAAYSHELTNSEMCQQAGAAARELVVAARLVSQDEPQN